MTSLKDLLLKPGLIDNLKMVTMLNFPSKKAAEVVSKPQILLEGPADVELDL